MVDLELQGRGEIESVLNQERQDMTRGRAIHRQLVPGHAWRLIVRACRTFRRADRVGWPIVEEEGVEVVVVDREDQVRLGGVEMWRNLRKKLSGFRPPPLDLHLDDEARRVGYRINCD